MNQLDKPAKGETIAVMHTSMGDISLRLFPDKTPKPVKTSSPTRETAITTD